MSVDDTSRATGRTQQERTEESTRRLAQAAIALIAEQGFERTSAGDIGARAGYSRSLISVRYGSKDEFVQSLFRDLLEPVLIPSMDEASDGLSRLQRYVDHVITMYRDEPDLSRAIYVLAFEAVGPVVSLKPWYSDWLVRYTNGVIDSFRMGQRDGSVRTDVDPEEEAEQFLCFGLGLGFRWAIDPERFDFGEKLARWRSRIDRIYAA